MTEPTPAYQFENLCLYQNDLDEMEDGRWINDSVVHLAGRKIELEANENCKNSEKKNV